jgi:hypothetical protein
VSEHELDAARSGEVNFHSHDAPSLPIRVLRGSSEAIGHWQERSSALHLRLSDRDALPLAAREIVGAAGSQGEAVLSRSPCRNGRRIFAPAGATS